MKKERKELVVPLTVTFELQNEVMNKYSGEVSSLRNMVDEGD